MKRVFFIAMQLVSFSLFGDMKDVLPDENKPFVTATSSGQLGNQMHQAAAGIVLAHKNGACYIHAESPNSKKGEYDEIFGKFRAVSRRRVKAEFPRNFLKHKLDPTYNYIQIKYHDDMMLRGNYLSYKYHHSNRELIVECFGPTKERVQELKNKYSSVFKEDVIVGLHIRTFSEVVDYYGSKKRVFSFFPPPNMGYLKKALEVFPDNALFVVFSDNIAWSKKVLKEFDRRFFFMEDSVLNDFYMLSLCHHNIISHSTFSWWAAYLNQNPEKIVVAPNPFFPRPNIKIEDIYPKDWILIDRVEDGLWPAFDGECCWEEITKD